MKLRVLALSAVGVVAAALLIAFSASPAAARDGCPAIGNVSSYHVYGLNAHVITCDHAKQLAIDNLAHHQRHTYHCTHTIHGRNVHMHCVDKDNTLRQYSVFYYVH